MAVKATERQLVDDSVRRLRELARIAVSCEVPILGRNVDLAYVRNEHVCTVEFKLRDWRRALRQARDHLLGADFAYICIPRRKVSDSMVEELRDTGVGLLFYMEEGEWPFEEVVAAPRSHVVSQVARSWTLEFIRNSEGQKTWQEVG